MSPQPHTLEALLTPAEFDPFRRAAAGDPGRLVDLYDWNAQVGTAFAESLRYLEVGLRHALDAAAREHLGDAWLTPHSPFLTRRSRHALDAAQRRARAGASRADVLAELPFGFWVALLAEPCKQALWSPALRFAFPEATRRAHLHRRLEELEALNEQITRHAPLHERNLLRDYDRVLEVARLLAPVLEQHLIVTSRVPEVLFCRPLLT